MVSGRARGFSELGSLAVGDDPGAEQALGLGLWALPLVLPLAFNVLFLCVCP